MIKKTYLLLLILFSALGLFGCSDSSYEPNGDEYENGSENSVLVANETAPERLMIYTVDISFDVDDLNEASTMLKSMIEDDEWFDEETQTSHIHYYSVRVKTERLDTFIGALQSLFMQSSYEKKGEDISLEYQDTTNRIAALEAQMARLLVLYENASLSDMIIINEQISEIEVELQSLQSTISEFDSLVMYSTVHVTFHGSTVITRSPFINRVGNGFITGLNSLLNFLDGFVIVIVTILPFVVIFGGLGLGGYFIYHKQRKKKIANKHEKKE